MDNLLWTMDNLPPVVLAAELLLLLQLQWFFVVVVVVVFVLFPRTVSPPEQWRYDP